MPLSYALSRHLQHIFEKNSVPRGGVIHKHVGHSTYNLAVLQNLIYAIILILIVIYKNAPGLKGFREKYNLKALLAKLAAQKQSQPKESGSKEVDAK